MDESNETLTNKNSELLSRTLKEESKNSTVLVDVTQSTQQANHTIKIAMVAILGALSAALSTAFIFFPYIELMTITLFLGGIILGPIYACALAIISASLYEIISTVIIGPGFIIFPFKLVAFLLIALSGAFCKQLIEKDTTVLLRLFFATIGGLLTIAFDLITNVGWIILAQNFNFIGYFTALLIGLPVTASKVVVNGVLFFFIPDVYKRAIKSLPR
ncbi:MAG: hypothetical protein ACTSXO_02480 [Candidatus Heimdallarchaeota archaeon]|nr:MAG: hypothetical protein DRP02_03810 [Candidatus Gerdarchaeota archaeon]RLI73089.1 MAG: hypothetical protein DRO91_03675 [Candidatus Heimdallarchaeota archaeon]